MGIINGLGYEDNEPKFGLRGPLAEMQFCQLDYCLIAMFL